MSSVNDELIKVRTYVGATGRQVRLQMKDDDGDIVDVSGYDSATVSARLGTGSSAEWKLDSVTVTIESGSLGWVNFTPLAVQIDEEGEYLAQIRFLLSGAVDYTEAFILEVVEPVFNPGD